MDDLPSELPEEPGLLDEFHDLPPQRLRHRLKLAADSREHWFTGTDLKVYYDPDSGRWHQCPDGFVALNVPHLYESEDLRLSDVVWQEQQSPPVGIEFLSPKTARKDFGRFDPESDRVIDPRADECPPPLVPTTTPPNKVEVYERDLGGPHDIVYSRSTQRLRYVQFWLRWCDPEGNWCCPDTEVAQQQAAAAQQRAERLAERRRSLSVDPDDI